MSKKDEKIFYFSTRGGSMFPFICWDEKIVIKKIAAKALRPNDIILFENGQKKICHRLVKIERKNGRLFFQTKGDRNKFYDQPISEERVLGKVIALKRRLRLINLSARGWRKFIYQLECLAVKRLFGAKKILKEMRWP